MRPPIVTGVCPVLETPFTAEGEIDEASFAALVEFQVGAGVHGVMFPGFASEYYKLTDDERDRLTAILLDRARTGDTATVISIPDHATRRSVGLLG